MGTYNALFRGTRVIGSRWKVLELMTQVNTVSCEGNDEQFEYDV